MKRIIVTAVLSVLCLVFYGQDGVPVSNLRPPAYPLITIDPYISAWSQSDNLYKDNVRHWTGRQHPLTGVIRVDGKVYRFMGKEDIPLKPVIKDAREERWDAKYTTGFPYSNWYKKEYSDKDWKAGKGAFGTPDMPNIGTEWNTRDIWTRRTFNLSDEDLRHRKFYIVYSHDDVFELFLNGQMIVNTGVSWNNEVVLQLTADQAKSLQKENNVIAVHCQNTRGGGYVDFGLFTEADIKTYFDNEADQVFVNVLPIQTYYSFYCGPVKLDIKFTSPLILNDLDLLSSPVNYISYGVTSTDNKNHDVQIYLSATPEWAVNTPDQEVETQKYNSNRLSLLKTGTKEQKVLGKCGDLIRIDWGYFYLAHRKSADTSLSFGTEQDIKSSFAGNGTLPQAKEGKISARLDKQMQGLAFVENMGSVGLQKKEGYLMIGYDDIESVQYFGENLKPYWKRKYATIEDAFSAADKNYAETMKKSREWDARVMEDSKKAGGQQYAEICAAAYRQSVAAHKLVTGPKGQLFFFSKENNSNGSIGTVDVTYPSCPLFLRYNTDIAKAMLEFIFDYSESGRWTKPFAAHDVGTYPLANGQTYNEDMPVEEASNMVIMTTVISAIDKNAGFAKKHWETLSTWIKYLEKEGLCPKDQLCTEDFAGHLTYNANLSAKAIMAIAGYGYMAKMLNKPEAGKYTEMAKNMMAEWEHMTDDNGHSRLAFDKPGTWSQKYNFVWDKILGFNIVPQYVTDLDTQFYLTKQNKYGLPLDNRFTWGKIDDTFWTATMAGSESGFLSFTIPLWKYVNETPTRVPMGDWYDTVTSDYINFRARSVVGGVFIKSLNEYMKSIRSK